MAFAVHLYTTSATAHQALRVQGQAATPATVAPRLRPASTQIAATQAQRHHNRRRRRRILARRRRRQSAQLAS